MQLTICAWDERVFSIEVDSDETVENVKAILEAESGVPSARQALLAGGKPLLDDRAKLSSVGVAPGDVLMLFAVTPNQAPAAPAGGVPAGGASRMSLGNSSHPALQLAADGSAVAPAALVQTAKADSRLMGQLYAHFTPLAQAIRDENLDRVQQLLRQAHTAQVEQQKELQQLEELADADPFDMEAQKRIEELIKKKNIEDNYLAAMESSPEVFAQVEMLYVNVTVNGVDVKAFVDSGAQMTIMTGVMAERCHLGRLMDTRFAGVAVGVGSSKIVGRIHQAPLLVAGHHTTTAITVLEQKSGPQFIFGLDMLRRHQCTINLKRNALEFGSCDAVLPFLGEAEVPSDSRQNADVQDAGQPGAGGSATEQAARSAGGGSSTSAGAPAAPNVAAGNAAAARAAATAAAPLSTIAGGHTSNPTPAAGGPAATGVPSGLEAAVASLQALGFSRDQCLQALRATNGDADAAGALLFGGF